MRDLSHLAADSLAVSSMAAGNMVSSNEHALTAPGSRPVDPLPDRTDQGDPAIEVGAPRAVGDDGKPEPSTSFSPSPLTWKQT